MDVSAKGAVDNTKVFQLSEIVSLPEIKTEFAELAKSSLDGLNHVLLESNKAIENIALGKAESTHEIILAIEKAKLSLQIAVEVRNKLVDAYKEITRMQI